MIIATAGYGSVGSSALLDFLKQYDDIQIIPFELRIIHGADGIEDLKYYLTQNRDRISCNAAINRFQYLMLKSRAGCKLRRIVGTQYDDIINKYVRQITIAEWKGQSNYDPLGIGDYSTNDVLRWFQKKILAVLRKINKDWHLPYKTRYYSIFSGEEFDSITKKFIVELLTNAGIDMSKNIVLDQMMSATNPKFGSEFFDDIKIISVDRDPRDNYMAAQLKKYPNAFMPATDVVSYVNYYRESRLHTIRENDVLYIKYEDLIYKYDETTQKIMNFLGMAERPQKEFYFFDPDISVKYTNMIRRKPECQKEIQYIEENLKEYLYEFKEYKPRSNEHMCTFKETFD